MDPKPPCPSLFAASKLLVAALICLNVKKPVCRSKPLRTVWNKVKMLGCILKLNRTASCVFRLVNDIRIKLPCSLDVLPPKHPFHQRIPEIRTMRLDTESTAPTVMRIFFFLSSGGSKSTEKGSRKE